MTITAQPSWQSRLRAAWSRVPLSERRQHLDQLLPLTLPHYEGECLAELRGILVGLQVADVDEALAMAAADAEPHTVARRVRGELLPDRAWRR